MQRAVGGLALACLVVVTGCGLGGEKSADPPRKSTRADLAIMVVAEKQLGAVAEGLELARDESGPTSNAEAAEDTIDPRDTAESLGSAGRISGYDLVYEAPRGLAAAKRSKGVVHVATSVELMRDPVYAAKYLNKRVADFERFEHKTVDGVLLKTVESVDVAGIGEEAYGLRLTVKGRAIVLHETLVAFRRGRLVGAAFIGRLDARRTEGQAQRAALTLDWRIQRGLTGSLDGEPPPAGRSRGGTATVDRDDLSSLTLAARDVDASVSDEGARRGKNFVVYSRTFEDVLAGRSHLETFTAKTFLYPTAAEGERAYRRLTSPKGRRAFAQGMLNTIAEKVGVQPRNVVIHSLHDAGRGVEGVTVAFSLPEGRLRLASMFVRSGRLVGAVTGLCTAFAFNPDDLGPLAEEARERFATFA
jgi:hypothetical protein